MNQEVAMLKNRVEKIKNNRSNDKVTSCECFEKKECGEALNRHVGSHEASKKELKMKYLSVERRVGD